MREVALASPQGQDFYSQSSLVFHARAQYSSSLEKRSMNEADLEKALSLFDPVWDKLFPKERIRIMQLLIERIDYNGQEGEPAITFRDTGIKTLVAELEEAKDTLNTCA